MAPWLHGTLYVHLHEAKNVPIDRIIRMPDKVDCSENVSRCTGAYSIA